MYRIIFYNQNKNSTLKLKRWLLTINRAILLKYLRFIFILIYVDIKYSVKLFDFYKIY